MEKWTEMRLVGFDVETTGLDPLRDRVVQFALCAYDPAKRQFVDSFAALCSPAGAVMNEEALAAHGISSDRLQGRPSFDHRLVHPVEVPELLDPVTHAVVEPARTDPSILAWLEQQRPFVFLAYNAPFDLAFLAAACWRTEQALPIRPRETLDPLAIARRYWRRNRLGELCRRLGVPLVGAHDALEDTQAAIRCMLELAMSGKAPSHLDALLARQAVYVREWERRSGHQFWDTYTRVEAFVRANGGATAMSLVERDVYDIEIWRLVDGTPVGRQEHEPWILRAVPRAVADKPESYLDASGWWLLRLCDVRTGECCATAKIKRHGRDYYNGWEPKLPVGSP